MDIREFGPLLNLKTLKLNLTSFPSQNLLKCNFLDDLAANMVGVKQKNL